MSRNIANRPHPVCAQPGCGHLRINHFMGADGTSHCDAPVSWGSYSRTTGKFVGTQLCRCPGFVSISDEPIEGPVSPWVS